MFPLPRREHPSLFAAYAPSPLNDAAVPAFPGREEDDEDEAPTLERNFDFELPRRLWRAIPPVEPHGPLPIRFVDGSIRSRLVGFLVVEHHRQPLIGAAISAVALRLENRTLRREACSKTKKVLCLNSKGIALSDMKEAEETLREEGIELVARESEKSSFDGMRRAVHRFAMGEMERMERDVMLNDCETPTLVDGLLERRLVGQHENVPVFGLVKRQMASYLPDELQELVYELEPGERTPAFVLGTAQHVSIVNVYLRLTDRLGISPSDGIVRLTAPREYLSDQYSGESLTSYLSGLAGYLYELRQRDLAYKRAHISIAPIVHVEDHLNAIMPGTEELVRSLNQMLYHGSGLLEEGVFQGA